MSGNEWIETAQKYLMNTYSQYPVVFVSGKGAELVDSTGKRYLDFVSGLAVTSLGHSHPQVAAAVARQAECLTHVSNLYYNQPQTELAALLVRNSFAGKAFFCNSGAEANEAAIKLARKYSFNKYGAERYEIITALNSFHGRTMGAVSATGQAKFQTGFHPLLPGFKYAPFSDMGEILRMADEKTAAIMIEPVQGEGGVILPSERYLSDLREFCTEKDILLIFDEVQTGIGRTGKMFAYEHFNVTPDIMTLAKGLANGMPIGAMLATDEAAAAFTPGAHASTFGGNPVSCSAGVAVLHALLESPAILQGCAAMGEYLAGRLENMKKNCSIIREIRGKGLLIGMELAVPGPDVVRFCLEEGLLVNCTAGNVIRLLPPINVTREESDAAVAILGKALQRLETR